MSRGVAWRNKPTQLITQMLPVANEYKLYLVNETGPTSFVFKDDNDNKFKVSIGFKLSCSCGVVQNDHCIHTLYVMLKRFRVPSTHPIIWQASYLDSELEGLVQQKYAEKKKEERKKHSYKKHVGPKKQQEEEDFPPLEQDSMCPICYEDMEGQCYSTCRTCHKSLHTKCFKIWTRHKEDSHLPVTCPLCRAQFQNPMTIIFKDLEKWQVRFSTHKGSTCKGCSVKPIRGPIYKCLISSNFQLCKTCFQGYYHLDHIHFATKTNIHQAWQLAPLRVRKNKKPIFQPNKEAPEPSKQQLGTSQFVVQLFPTLKQYNSTQQPTSFAVVGNDILTKQACMKCKTAGSDAMRRLNCGHVVHQECLIDMLEKQEFCCEIDQQVFCSGYFEVVGIKVTKTKPKKNTMESTKMSESRGSKQSKLGNLQINGVVPKIKPSEKRTQSVNQANKSRDKNFRIMKRTAGERRQQVGGLGGFGMMVVTGLGQQGSQPVTQHTIGQERSNLPPRMRSNIYPSYR